MSGTKPILCSLILLLTSALSPAQGGNASRNVELTAPDGTKLVGDYFAAANAGPGLILFHQCNMNRKAWEPLVKLLTEAGINVLAMDNRGFGDSGGKRYETLTPEEENNVTNEVWPRDFDVEFQYLLSQPGVQHDKIGAGGASCGVNNAIQLARRHPEVKALALLSGGTSQDGRSFLHKPGAVPILTAAADDDVFGNVTQIMQWFYSLSPNAESRFQKYETGGHGAQMFSPHPDLLALITRWFTATLNSKADRLPSTNGVRLPEEQMRDSELIDQPDGINKAKQIFAEARKRDPKAQPFSEFIVNFLGYERMQAGDPKGAVELMKLNVDAYPDAPNAYDSLADAYQADGQKDLARENAKKALALLAGDTRDSEQRKQAIRQNSERKLKELGQ